MSKTSKLEVVASSLDAALRQVEQRCQEIRWRLATFPADVAVEDLKDEIDAFAVEASWSLGCTARRVGWPEAGLLQTTGQFAAALSTDLNDMANAIASKLCEGGEADVPLFTTPKGKRWSDTVLSYHFQQARLRPKAREILTLTPCVISGSARR